MQARLPHEDRLQSVSAIASLICTGPELLSLQHQVSIE
jgi:hypothetical protein